MHARTSMFEHMEEWNLWKTIHNKNYNSHLEELEKHIIWSANKAYIDQHNINAKKNLFSYELKLNHLADLVQ